MAFCILRTKKLSSKGSIGGSGQHTFRERETKNADPSTTPSNYILHGPNSSAGIIDVIGNRLEETKPKFVTRKNANPVLAIEYFIGYSSRKSIPDPAESRKYFEDSLEWLRKKHGADNVVSASVHLDETTPHLVAYVVPIVDRGGKERKYSVGDGKNTDGTQRRKMITKTVGAETWLSAREFVGTRELLSDMQTDFAESVGSKYGLKRGIKGSKAIHRTVKSWYGEKLELPGRIADASRDVLIEFGQRAYVAAKSQKEALDKERTKFEQLRTDAQRALEKLRADAEKSTGEHREQLLAAEQTIADQGEQIRDIVKQGESRAQSLREWIVAVLDRVWDALTAPAGGGLAAARLELEYAALELQIELPEVPAERILVRELAAGGWRASVINADDIELFSDVYDDKESAQAGAESWIAGKAAAPSM